jgi:hypothetical protein
MTTRNLSSYIIIAILFVSCFTSHGGGGGVYLATMPEFNLPPPQPSATDVLPGTYFTDCKYLKQINTKLLAALAGCGYSRRSYYHAPNGFALVTQLERINENGMPKQEKERWETDMSLASVFSLKSYFKSLFFSNQGYYRCIVFLITNANYTSSQTTATKKLANEWLKDGSNKLNTEIGDLPVTDDYSFDVLIYEFKKNENDNGMDCSIVLPSPITGRTHLKNTEFFKYLK